MLSLSGVPPPTPVPARPEHPACVRARERWPGADSPAPRRVVGTIAGAAVDGDAERSCPSGYAIGH